MSKETKRKRLNFRDRKLLFVDLETSGLYVDRNEILEVGCLVVDGGSLEIINKYHAKVKPKHIETATEEAIKMLNYSADKWQDAREVEDVLKEVAVLAPHGMMAGWKVDFDWSFLEKGFNLFNIPHTYDYHLIDVISIAYNFFRDKESPIELTLGSVCRELGVPIHEKHSEGIGHNAMDDIIATYEVFKKLMSLK